MSQPAYAEAIANCERQFAEIRNLMITKAAEEKPGIVLNAIRIVSEADATVLDAEMAAENVLIHAEFQALDGKFTQDLWLPFAVVKIHEI